MKKIIGISFLTVIGLTSYTLGWSYPITEITNKECTTNKRACSYELPKIEGANYLKYKNDNLYRETYSMLRGTTYYDGRDLGLGGHQGIDIATDTGTPVSSTEDGIIIVAEEKGGRGNVITIKHTENGKDIYSSYAHLSEILVKVGQSVKEGEIIGKVGSTGNSTGPHIHFQIEINENDNHPFFYKNCEGETKEIVNEARCERQMIENTIDPILFIEKQGRIPIKKNKNNENSFIDTYGSIKNISFSGFSGGLASKNDINKITLTSKNNLIQILEKPITIEYDKKIISLLPDTFEVVKNKQIMIVPKKTGITIITFKHEGKIIKKIPIIIADKDFLEKTKSALNKNPNLVKALFE